MRKLVARLSTLAFLRGLVQSCRIHHLANWYLRLFPITKTMPSSGIRYRAARLESIPLGIEMLEEKKTYPERFLPVNLTTFADLGCNVGYFACLLAHVARNRNLCGLMVDANPEAVSEAKWHARANGLGNVFALQGIVGENGPGNEATFYVYASNICSSTEKPPAHRFHLPGRWKQITAPHLKIEDIWQEKFGDLRCQLLKIDVEGSELHFLQTEESFLRRVDSILLEWHKWRADLSAVERVLKEQGFSLIEVLDEDDNLGTGLFRRKDCFESISRNG